MSDEHVLYRMRDADGALLYVGITLSVEGRLRAHRGDKPWWRQIANIELEHFDTREQLEAAEVAAIRAEEPVFNLLRYKAERAIDRPAVRPIPVTPHVRVAPTVWDVFGVVSKTWPAGGGRPRSRQLSHFMRWYTGDVALAQPERPDPRSLQRLHVNRRLREHETEQVKAYALTRGAAATWTEFCPIAVGAGESPAVALSQIVLWYLRLPGAKLPPRPGD